MFYNEVHLDYSHMNAPSDPSKIPLVFFYNGTFNPIHIAHINVLCEAKKYAESIGRYEFLGAFVSPGHASYARHKLGLNFLPTRDRLNMIQMAIEDYDWIALNTYECYQESRLKIHETVCRFRQNIMENVEELKDGNFEVFWLRGIDSSGFHHLVYPWLHTVVVSNREEGDHGTARKNEIKRIMNDPSDPYHGKVHIVECPNLDISSTNIRKLCSDPNLTEEERKSKLSAMLRIPKVADYVVRHKFWSSQETPLFTSQIVEGLGNSLDLFDLDHNCFSHMLTTYLNPAMDKKLYNKIRECNYVYSNIKYDRGDDDEGEDEDEEKYHKYIEFHNTDILVNKTGFSSTMLRINKLKYSDRFKNPVFNNIYLDDKPSSMVVKVSVEKKVEDIRKQVFCSYWNTELNFYQNLAPKLSCFRIPKCYFSSYGKTKNSLLFLEDLSSCSTWKVLDGVPEKYVYLIMECMGEFHATFWKNTAAAGRKSLELSWVRCVNNDEWKEFFSHIYLRTFGKGNLTSFDETTRELWKHFDTKKLLDKLASDGPSSLCHGDLWAGNILFDEKNDQPVFIDWQWLCYSNPLIDVAFFLFNSITVECFKKNEDSFLKHYYRILCTNGVEISFDKVIESYEYAKLWSLIFNLRTVGLICPEDRALNNISNVKSEYAAQFFPDDIREQFKSFHYGKYERQSSCNLV
eukprot:TRINITY_DN296_c8_g1_i1.p1 TRINITY_DN296_c8_g1~~TRINITY_DN296_c8_g1_i1.p1  ORF type:complete len:687 (+),score=115.55 TRINITY_DN296_c8_g1_i1:47-2107(+)